MGKIYSPPTEIENTANQFLGDWDAYNNAEKIYEDAILTYALKNGSGEYAGEELRISHADGYARYAVLSLKPVKLIHMPIGDAWEAPYVHRMTASDIKWEIDRGKKLQEFLDGRVDKG